MQRLFAPDPVGGFPPGSAEGTASASGMLHLLFGAIGFVAVAAAAEVVARWHRGAGRHDRARLSRTAAVTIVGGFVAGAALSTSTVGVGLIWIAVLAMWGWLAWCAVDLYRRVPDPVIARRTPSPAAGRA